MPSPFPGMDPYIEGQVWEDFHTDFIIGIRASLTPNVIPRYVVRVEERVYLEHLSDERAEHIRPDVTIVEREGGAAPLEDGVATATAVAVEPVVIPLSMPERVQEAFLTIRERESMEVITVIEVLSPTNKRLGSNGQREYLEKRDAVLLSAAHLVELDLLRGGERLPMAKPLPPADYYAFVCRRYRRPNAEVYPWSLRHRLPPIPVPLAGRDPDVVLDLQAVLNTVYDRARYDYLLDYKRPVEPPLNEADAAWAQSLLGALKPAP